MPRIEFRRIRGARGDQLTKFVDGRPFERVCHHSTTAKDGRMLVAIFWSDGYASCNCSVWERRKQCEHADALETAVARGRYGTPAQLVIHQRHQSEQRAHIHGHEEFMRRLEERPQRESAAAVERRQRRREREQAAQRRPFRFRLGDWVAVVRPNTNSDDTRDLMGHVGRIDMRVTSALHAHNYEISCRTCSGVHYVNEEMLEVHIDGPPDSPRRIDPTPPEPIPDGRRIRL